MTAAAVTTAVVIAAVGAVAGAVAVIAILVVVATVVVIVIEGGVQLVRHPAPVIVQVVLAVAHQRLRGTVRVGDAGQRNKSAAAAVAGAVTAIAAAVGEGVRHSVAAAAHTQHDVVARHEGVAVHKREAEVAVHVVAHEDPAERVQVVRLERAVALERQEAAVVVGRRHGRVDVQVHRESLGGVVFL